MIRLVGIDVDGTLVGASGEVDPRVWRAVDRALAAGIRLALCSGRPAFGRALGYAQRLDPQGWHIFQNGASIVSLATGASLSTPLPGSAVGAIVAQARSTRSVLELYNDREYAAESEHEWAYEHADLLGVAFEPRSFDSLAAPIVRAQWLVPFGDIRRVTAAAPVGVEVAQSTSPLMPDVAFVGMTRSGTTKGAAMRAIAAEYGVPLSEAMYVGDAKNDLPAFAVVGHAIAMGNADPAVIEAAARTVAHVNDAGLAEALEWAIAGA